MTRFSTLTIAACGLLASLLDTTPASAHHSGAMFDMTRTVTLDATVKEFDWTNPHVVMWVYTNPKAGEQPELWTVEFTSPGNLARQGMNRHSVQPGDHVLAEISPLRDGTHGGQFRKITLADTGQVLMHMEN